MAGASKTIPSAVLARPGSPRAEPAFAKVDRPPKFPNSRSSSSSLHGLFPFAEADMIKAESGADATSAAAGNPGDTRDKPSQARQDSLPLQVKSAA
jgi:hypothetical protein